MKSARTSPLILATLILAASSIPAEAALTGFDAFGNREYTQTANNTMPSGTPQDFFASRLFYSSSGDITSASGISGSVATSFPYTPQSGNYALYQTGFITPSALNSYLALGANLSFSVSGGNLAGASGASPTYGPAIFASAVPYLTGNSYTALQGLNSAMSQTVTFNGFTANSGANESDIFVTISNAMTGAVVYSTSFFNNLGATSLTLAANTLAAGTSYNLELDYSSRLNTTGAFNNTAVPFTFGNDVRTEVGFVTAASVPEPASLLLTSIGAASVALIRARRRSK